MAEERKRKKAKQEKEKEAEEEGVKELPLEELQLYRPSPRRSSINKSVRWSRAPSLTSPRMQNAVPHETIGEVYDQLQSLICKLEAKLDATIEKEQTDFFQVYKTQLLKVQSELNYYRKKLDEEELKRQHDSLVVSLEQSLGHSKKESGRLAEVVATQKAEIKRLKDGAEKLVQENTFFQGRLKKAKRKIQALKLVINKLQALQQESSKKSAVEAKPHSVSPGSPSPKQPEPKAPHHTLAYQSRSKPSTEPNNPYNYNVKFEAFVQCLKTSGWYKEQALDYCLEYYRKHERKQEGIFANLQRLLSIERKNVHNIRANQAALISGQQELEQLFYDCVAEVRRSKCRSKLEHSPEPEEEGDGEMHLSADHIKAGTQKAPTLTKRDKLRIMEQFFTNDILLQALCKSVFSSSSRLLPELLLSKPELSSKSTSIPTQQVGHNMHKRVSSYGAWSRSIPTSTRVTRTRAVRREEHSRRVTAQQPLRPNVPLPKKGVSFILATVPHDLAHANV